MLLFKFVINNILNKKMVIVKLRSELLKIIRLINCFVIKFSWTVDLEILIYCYPFCQHFLDHFSTVNFSINFPSFLIIFDPHFGWRFLCQFLPTYTVPWSPGWKIDKFRSILDPDFRFLLYSSVYIFRSERSAPRPPKKWHFRTPILRKAQPICGEWHFYRALFGGRFWGRKVGELL
jgi:hypothetical protein